MIDKESELPVTKQFELLGVNRSSVYYQPVAVPVEDLAVMRPLDELDIDRPNRVWAAAIPYIPMARDFC